MKKPIFSNEHIRAENKYLQAIQRDFVDSKGREGNIITLKSQKQGNGGFVFALTKENKVILIKEYEFGPHDFIYKFPSGWVENGISPEQNIKNELQEESGYNTDKPIKYIGKTTQNGYISGYNELYFTTECYKTGELTTHEGEDIIAYTFTLNEIESMFKNNEILNPYSISLYYMIKDKTNNFTNLNI